MSNALTDKELQDIAKGVMEQLEDNIVEFQMKLFEYNVMGIKVDNKLSLYPISVFQEQREFNWNE